MEESRPEGVNYHEEKRKEGPAEANMGRRSQGRQDFCDVYMAEF